MQERKRRLIAERNHKAERLIGESNLYAYYRIQKLIMPIKKENISRYPKNWKEIRLAVLERAGNKCEFCGIENYTIKENGSKVVLTIAHLDHTPENCDLSNLRALCQKCHLTYDAKHHAKNASHTRALKEQTLSIQFND